MKLLTKFLLAHFFIYLVFVTNGFSLHEEPDLSSKKKRDSVTMIVIPAGEFLMGSKSGEGRADERPQRKVKLDAYAIDIHEVTNSRYLNFIHSTGRKEPPNPYSNKLLSEETGTSELPVVQITWYDAVDYCRWAGKRLPTEAEWEKAARGNHGAKFPWGSDAPQREWVNFERNWNETKTLWPVGSSPQTVSPYGVHDMAGNVREWVQDWYAVDFYMNGPHINPHGPQHGILKVIKGGSWHSYESDIRAASRGKGGFALKTDGIGFRCAQSIL